MRNCPAQSLRIFAVCLLVIPTAWSQEIAEFKVQSAAIKYIHSPKADGDPAPLLVALPDSPELAAATETFNQWKSSLAGSGWLVVVPVMPGGTDPAAKILELLVHGVAARLNADPLRVLLAGAGNVGSDVFYAVARTPGVYAAGVAVQANPTAAISSAKLFAANTINTPVLWIHPPNHMDEMQRRLREAGFNFEVMADAKLGPILEWMNSRRRAQFPLKLDFETHSPAFAEYAWIKVTKFDPSKRNAALPTSRVYPGTGASLDLGGFGYDPDAPGPGLLVAFLPDGYKGPLQSGDRILSVGDRKIENGVDYMKYIDTVSEEKSIGVMIDRGGRRERIETRIVLPSRTAAITARFQAEYVPSIKEVLLITRGVAALQLTIPEDWAPSQASLNGLDLPKIESPGCYEASLDGQTATMKPCSAGQ